MITLFLGCQKDEVAKKIDLTGVYVGKTTGKIDPWYFDGTARWLVTQQGNEIWADITYQNVYANGPGVTPTSDYKIPLMKYKGTMINDSTFQGGFLTSFFNMRDPSIVNGKISSDGKRIICNTSGSDVLYSYVRFNYDLTKE